MKKILAMLLAALMLCSAMSVSFAEGYDFESTVDWYEETYDVIVIGYGLAGATAAITASDLGAKVLVTEKAPEGHEGGNSKYAGQVIVSPLESSHDAFISYYSALMNDYPDAASPEMLEAYFEKASKNEEWMIARFNDIGQEVDLRPFRESTGGFWNEYPEFEGAELATRVFTPGQSFSGCLYYLAADNVVARDIDVWYEAPGVHLIQDPISKEILGVQIEKDGELVNVRATAGVVMAMGGFQCNPELMATYLHNPYTTNRGGEYNDGDGIYMALEVGAQLWHMGNVAGFLWGVEAPGTTRQAGSVTPSMGILVGSDGTRFISETVENRHGKVNVGGRWMAMPTSDRNYIIADDAVVSTTKFSSVFSDGNVDEIESGWVIKADTIEELAEKINVPAENLAATVAQWNGFVDAGEDPRFERNMSSAVKIENGPFYALEIKATQYNTQGGAKRNEKAEVLDTSNNPIPHLYSAGEFGSMFSDMYNGGSNLAECVAYGQIAAESAVANMAK